jgi:hypothetical protein
LREPGAGGGVVAGLSAAEKCDEEDGMAEMRKLTGGCHCGKVRYEVTTDLARVASCNCSICSKAGSLLTFVDRSQFTLLSGEDALTDYQFNRNVIHHLFCSSCGVKSFVRGTAPSGKEVVAVNARCLDGVDIDALTLTPFDGKSL